MLAHRAFALPRLFYAGLVTGCITYSAIAAAGEITSLDVSTGKAPIAEICNIVVREALLSVDIQMHAVYLPVERTSRMINEGMVDASVCRIAGFEKKFSNMLRIDPKIVPLESNVFSHKLSLELTKDDWQSLKPYRLGIHADHYYATEPTKSFPDVRALNNNYQILKMLDLDRLDAGVMITIEALVEMKTNTFNQSIVMLQPPIAEFPLHFYIHKKHRDLIPKLNQAMANIVNSGRAAQIYQEYLGKILGNR